VVRALAIDVGSTSIRTAVVDITGVVSHVHYERLRISTPSPGEVELDALEIVRLVIDLANRTLADAGPCEVVGITNQRATTIVFDPTTGQPVGPALGWQDLRTVIDCLVLQGQGVRFAPNQSATKAQWLVNQASRPAHALRFATVETWIVWHLTNGTVHVTDRSNAGVNGLINADVSQWDDALIELLGLDRAMMPVIVDTMCDVGPATALTGGPRITALIGDQPASLFGQSCVTSGTKITLGTGAMLNSVRGAVGPATLRKFDSGCFPIVAYSVDQRVTWGLEGMVLSAGSCIEWLRDDLGLISDAAQSAQIAESVASCDGVSFVPALSGLGTPFWDFGARGGFYGLTRGTTNAHMVRAVLEGIAHRCADLVDAAEHETGQPVKELRVDGGMSANHFLVQRLADFTGAHVAVSPEREATTRGAGLMALVSAGHLTLADVEALWQPDVVLAPSIDDELRNGERDQWRRTVARAQRLIPELSAIEF
jgi:glycerol kinase